MLDTPTESLLFIATMLAFIALGTKSWQIALSALLITITSTILTFREQIYPFYISVYHEIPTFDEIPTFVWVIISVWVYLNLGWRFAEYKLGLEKRWNNIHPVYLHFIIPGRLVDGTYPNDIIRESFLDVCLYRPTSELHSVYKLWSMFFFGPALFWNIIIIAILWFLWLATFGRFHPISPAIWKVYRQNSHTDP